MTTDIEHDDDPGPFVFLKNGEVTYIQHEDLTGMAIATNRKVAKQYVEFVKAKERKKIAVVDATVLLGRKLVLPGGGTVTVSTVDALLVASMLSGANRIFQLSEFRDGHPAWQVLRRNVPPYAPANPL